MTHLSSRFKVLRHAVDDGEESNPRHKREYRNGESFQVFPRSSFGQNTSRLTLKDEYNIKGDLESRFSFQRRMYHQSSGVVSPISDRLVSENIRLMSMFKRVAPSEVEGGYSATSSTTTTTTTPRLPNRAESQTLVSKARCDLDLADNSAPSSSDPSRKCGSKSALPRRLSGTSVGMENQYRPLAVKPADQVLEEKATKVAPREGKVAPREGKVAPREGKVAPREGKVAPSEGKVAPRFSDFIARDIESASRDLAPEENVSRRPKDQLLPDARQVSVEPKVDTIGFSPDISKLLAIVLGSASHSRIPAAKSAKVLGSASHSRITAAPKSAKVLGSASHSRIPAAAPKSAIPLESTSDEEMDVETTEFTKGGFTMGGFTMGSPSSTPFPLTPGTDEVAMSNCPSLDGSFFGKRKIAVVEPNVVTPEKRRSSTDRRF